MNPEELIKLLDRELDLYVKGGYTNFKNADLATTKGIDSEYEPIVDDYVNNIKKLYINSYSDIKTNLDSIAFGVGALGWVSSTLIGASIGAIVGYLAEGPSAVEEYASNGAAIALVGEVFLTPSGSVIGKKYIKRKIKECDGPREVYRTNVLMKLNDL